MEIGNQIKALRQRRGITQEAMAQHFGITPQAVSKWERGVATPDIAMLPDISAYFGVTIDELFSLSDETRMERIQNMLWDLRFLEPATVENERRFLLEKAQREPENPDIHCMLAQIELHLAREHQEKATEYALEILRRAPEIPYVGFMYLAQAMNGVHIDPRFNLRNELIAIYKAFAEKHPNSWEVYEWLIGQLIQDHRLEEAKHYLEELSKFDCGYIPAVHQIKIALAEQDIPTAQALWEKMGQDYPDNFTVWQWIGDFQTQSGDYASAKESYRHSIRLLKAPRYKDPIVALALVCEMDGDYTGAIEARQFELEIADKEWHDTEGESVDYIKREIARLELLAAGRQSK